MSDTQIKKLNEPKLIKIIKAELSIGTERFHVPEYEGKILLSSKIESYRNECYKNEEKTLGIREYVNEMDKKIYHNYRIYFTSIEVENFEIKKEEETNNE